MIENIEEEQEETTILVEDEETESFELQRKAKEEPAEEMQQVRKAIISDLSLELFHGI